MDSEHLDPVVDEHPSIDSVLSPTLDEPLDRLLSNSDSILEIPLNEQDAIPHEYPVALQLQHLCQVVTAVEENLLSEPGPSHHSITAPMSPASHSERLSTAPSLNNELVSCHQEVLAPNVLQNVNHMVTVYTWTTVKSAFH